MQAGIPLAELTSLGVGGPAEWLAAPSTVEQLRTLLDRGSVTLLGGGSNLLVADAGLPGIVARYKGASVRVDGERVWAEAGVVWDELVRSTVEAGLAGIECLSGIPGRVGAAPMQNIGAYGQEVAEVLQAVEALDRGTGEVVSLAARDCAFGYRRSRFQGEWAGRYAITGVVLKLRRGPPAPPAYAELAAVCPEPSLATLRAAVLGLRRGKGMVLDPADPDSRSAGSFFKNPLVAPDVAEAVAERSRHDGHGDPPRHRAGGLEKLSAAWLIERAGVRRGERCGGAAVSSKHVLALTNRGSATALDVARLAASIRARVAGHWGIRLTPEPVFLGWGRSGEAVLQDLEAT